MPVNAGLALLIILALAMISSDLVVYRLGKTFPTSALPARSKSDPTTAGPEALTSFASILEQGLFGPAARGKLTAIAAGQQQAKTPTVNQNDLLLLGTAVGSFRETFALIRKISSKEERVFRLGDTVFDGGELVSVHKEDAEILSNGQRIKILSPTAAAATAPSPTSAAASPANGLATQVGAGSFIIDQRALNAALDNIGQAMTDARLLPSSKDGKVEGFRVSEVRPSGIFATVGIKNGDVLLRINDFPIDSPEKAIQSFASLKGQTRIKLDLIRDGQPTTFNYDIR